MAQPVPHASDPLVGQVLLDQYLIEALLAKGGMGNIYRARQQRLGRTYAIKVLRPEFTSDGKVVKRFVREALAVSQLRHPHTVQIFDSGETPEGIHFIVMEFLEGESLDRRIARDKRLDPESAIAFVGQAAAALAEAHEKGIVHRDLKPANIFIVQADGVPEFIKVLDFGIAKFYTGRKDGQELTKLTAAGSTMGTPHYMAPEQIRGEEVDGRADIYSLGVILWEALVGKPPYEGDSPMEVFLGHLEQPIPDIAREFQNPVPPGLEVVLRQALAKDPNERFASMRQFKTSLDRIIGLNPNRPVSGSIRRSDVLPSVNQRVDTQLEGPALQRRRSILAIGVLAAILVVGIIAFVVIFVSSDDETVSASDNGAVGLSVAHVKIHSEPSGAEVFQGSESLGTTPLHLESDTEEEMQLELKAPNYESVVVNLTATPGEVRGVAAVLPPAGGASPTGPDADVMTIWVESEPSGAAIHKDGRATGYVTPYSLKLATQQSTPIQIGIVRKGFATEQYTILPQPGGTMVLSSTLLPEGDGGEGR